MVANARRAAEAAGVTARFMEGDAEDLPVKAASADVVMSSFACMFAPRHAVTAGELARVLRPGGRMGVLAWTPDSDISQFIRVTAPHLPPPRPRRSRRCCGATRSMSAGSSPRPA